MLKRLVTVCTIKTRSVGESMFDLHLSQSIIEVPVVSSGFLSSFSSFSVVSFDTVESFEGDSACCELDDKASVGLFDDVILSLFLARSSSKIFFTVARDFEGVFLVDLLEAK